MARWTARVVGGLLLVLYAGRVIAEGLPDLSRLTLEETLGMIVCGVMLVGLVVALWSEPVGALLIVGGYAWFAVLERDLNLTNPFVLFPVAGFLYIASWQLDAAAHRTHDPPGPREDE